MIAPSLALAAALGLPPVAQNPTSLFWAQEAKVFGSDPAPSESFGTCLALQGDTLLVGEPWDGATATGAVHVYVFDGASWNHLAKLVGSDPSDVLFGHAISLDGDRALIGTNTSAAYVFHRIGTTWSETTRLRPSLSTFPNISQFGDAVALWGDTAYVGTPGEEPLPTVVPGAVYLFEYGAGTWSLRDEYFAAVPTTGDYYGAALAAFGDTVLVGAPYNDDAGLLAGTAFVNRYSAGSWTEIRQLLASDGAQRDLFGQHVALSGDTAVVAATQNVLAPGATGSSAGEGSVYVFERDLGGPDNWGELVRLTANDTNTPSEFGSSLALDGDRLTVGAPSARGHVIDDVQALAFDVASSKLYGADTASNVLIVIQTSTGTATPVGPLGYPDVVGLAFDPNTDTLYGVDSTFDTLLVIDTSTGAATPVGSLGFAMVSALAFDPLTGTLYGSDTMNDRLLTIDTATGAGAVIGSYGFPQPNQNVDGLAIDPATGTLYGVRAPKTAGNPYKLVTIDTSTGLGTVVGDTGMTNVLGLDFAGAAGLLGAKGPGNLLVEIDTSTGDGTVVGPFSTSESNVGAVFVFERDAGGPDAWGRVARITPPPPARATCSGVRDSACPATSWSAVPQVTTTAGTTPARLTCCACPPPRRAIAPPARRPPAARRCSRAPARRAPRRAPASWSRPPASRAGRTAFCSSARTDGRRTPGATARASSAWRRR